jgi:hypothetical protein
VHDREQSAERISETDSSFHWFCNWGENSRSIRHSILSALLDCALGSNAAQTTLVWLFFLMSDHVCVNKCWFEIFCHKLAVLSRRWCGFSNWSCQTSSCMCRVNLLSYTHMAAYTLWKTSWLKNFARTESARFLKFKIIFVLQNVAIGCARLWPVWWAKILNKTKRSPFVVFVGLLRMYFLCDKGNDVSAVDVCALDAMHHKLFCFSCLLPWRRRCLKQNFGLEFFCHVLAGTRGIWWLLQLVT